MNFETLMDRVVVITGASSGIGRLAVEEFLKEGAKVVLAARSNEDMQAHIQELNAMDRALIVPTDVSRPEDLKQVAQQAVERFGRVDVWVNNAGISLYGYVDETPLEDMRRVIDVDLMGAIYGMKAALEVF